MGSKGRTPVVNVSSVHTLTTIPQLCIAPTNINSIRFGASISSPLDSHTQGSSRDSGLQTSGTTCMTVGCSGNLSITRCAAREQFPSVSWTFGDGEWGLGVVLAPMHSFSLILPPVLKVQFIGISAQHRRLSESSGLLSFGALWTPSRTYWLVVLFAVAPHSGGYSFRLFARVVTTDVEQSLRTTSAGIHVELAGARPCERCEE